MLYPAWQAVWFLNVCGLSQKSSGALCEGIFEVHTYGSHNSCRRQRSHAVFEPFLVDALQQGPAPVRGESWKETHTAWKNALKVEKKAGGFKSEKWK